jgi:hypothetical protein
MYFGFFVGLRICGVGEGNGRMGMGAGVGSGSGGSRRSGIWLIIIFLFRLFGCYGELLELFFA